MGVTLVLVSLVMLSAAAAGGNVVVTRSHARSIGDVIAVSAARSLQITASSQTAGSNDGSVSKDGSVEACLMAAHVADANGIALKSCSQRGSDVVVEVMATTSVPFIPTVRSISVAGPGECG